MLAIIVLIVVGRQFYELAKKYEQGTAWVYPILGIVSYYGGQFLISAIYLIIIELSGGLTDEVIDSLDSGFTLTIIAILGGVVSCVGFYQLLKRSWKKKYEEKQRSKPKISDIGKSEEEEKPTEDFLIGKKDLGDLSKKKDDNDWRF